MEDLLKQWSKLAPTECDPAALKATLRSLTPQGGAKRSNDLSGFHDQIQGKVQRAIVARGWYWELKYWPPREKHKGEVAFYAGEWLDDPAEALLSAYVAALKAEAK